MRPSCRPKLPHPLEDFLLDIGPRRLAEIDVEEAPNCAPGW